MKLLDDNTIRIIRVVDGKRVDVVATYDADSDSWLCRTLIAKRGRGAHGSESRVNKNDAWTELRDMIDLALTAKEA